MNDLFFFYYGILLKKYKVVRICFEYFFRKLVGLVLIVFYYVKIYLFDYIFLYIFVCMYG